MSKKNEPIPYKRFRTGYTYRDIAAMVWSYSDDPRTWLNGSTKTTAGPDGKKKWNRRRLILGKWHELKTEMYEHYLRDFHRIPASDQPADTEAIPF